MNTTSIEKYEKLFLLVKEIISMPPTRYGSKWHPNIKSKLEITSKFLYGKQNFKEKQLLANFKEGVMSLNGKSIPLKYRNEFYKAKLEIIVPMVHSYRQTLAYMGLKPAGGNYKLCQNLIKINDIDISHFTGQGHLRGKHHSYKTLIPLEEILVENSTYTCNHSLKIRLFKAGLIEDKCKICGITEWRGEKLSLHLDHENGKNDDHRLENLRLLCPNCHSLTKTYCGKNKGKQITKSCKTELSCQTQKIN
jgi:hypothetical protein